MTDKDIADQCIHRAAYRRGSRAADLKRKTGQCTADSGRTGRSEPWRWSWRRADFLKEHNVRLIGTTAETIKKAEDRLEFKDTMEKIGEPVAASKVVENVEDGVEFTNTIGYPVVLRPAYTLGGSGGGIAHNQVELDEILAERSASFPCRTGTGRALHRGLERDRVRGNA